MKKLILPFVALALVSFTVMETRLTDAERLVAMTEMTATHDHLEEVLDGLSEEQLNYKSDPNSWSIAECTEHIAISETNIFNMLTEALKSPADPSKKAAVKLTDEQILEMVVDRSKKMKTSEAFEPSGKFGSHDAAVAEFKAKRIDHIKYVATTEDNLRDHFAETPLGTVDAYQILLFMSAHTERHVLQMEEILANEDFPEE
ncbi:DinB family protein [Ulvibacter litoralis]|uniref:DinB superfamily protein n=1 Tax=Ulvibacter litoralis TaxID=227084 RepID=A0A1G7I2N7_9FLAO|nr:DinB family protein [Ulvibacter litoralis]GHC62666.1 hypothetical protein GCM10008083_29830 [Ulvibacter litoralis]SDF06992.1 DinB superfamily protein [Ulvibacter litoralis]